MSEEQFKTWLEEKLIETDGSATEESSSHWQFYAFEQVYEKMYNKKPNLLEILRKLEK